MEPPACKEEWRGKGDQKNKTAIITKIRVTNLMMLVPTTAILSRSLDYLLYLFFKIQKMEVWWE